jgi:hypothetical protein
VGGIFQGPKLPKPAKAPKPPPPLAPPPPPLAGPATYEPDVPVTPIGQEPDPGRPIDAAMLEARRRRQQAALLFSQTSSRAGGAISNIAQVGRNTLLGG